MPVGRKWVGLKSNTILFSGSSCQNISQMRSTAKPELGTTCVKFASYQDNVDVEENQG